ncbi:M56 family metallopeptidase [Paenibacillus lautus]|uniref:M56 family metallopeptidase n=1 Tax=Paenibacillus TaxID=44249 RepID=UPI002FBD9D59
MKSAVKTNLIFLIMLLTGLFVLIQMGWYVAHQVLGVPLNWNIIQYCLTAIQEDTLGHDIIKVLFNLVILYTVVRLVGRSGRQLFLTWKWMRTFRNNIDHQQTLYLNKVYQDWNTEIMVVRDDAFIALAMGIWHPRIVISTGLMNMFNEEEVRAILLHEWYHCRGRDPLQMFLVVLLTESMGYIPLLKTLSNQFATRKELLADRFALRHMKSEYHLGNVLLKLSTLVNNRHITVAVPFANTAINYRILQVLQPEQPLHIPFSYGKSLLSTIIIFCIMIGLISGGCS